VRGAGHTRLTEIHDRGVIPPNGDARRLQPLVAHLVGDPGTLGGRAALAPGTNIGLDALKP